MSTDDVLQRIDAVLDEPVDDSWTRGPDAMRWTAEDPAIRKPFVVPAGDLFVGMDGSRVDGTITFAPWSRPDADPLADVAALLERAAAAPPIVFDVEAFHRVTQQLGEVGVSAIRVINDSFRRLGEGLSAASSQDAYTLMPPPLDTLPPRDRALEARRRRGTGPAQRRLDGRRG